VLLAVSAPALAQTQRVDVDLTSGFEYQRTGRGAPGSWEVVEDATAVNGRALAQRSTDRTGFRFPLAIYQPISAKNVEVAVRFKPVAGRVDQAGGIAVRLLTPDNYYVVRANALEDNVRFYRVVNGDRHELRGANLKVAPGQWHTLSLQAVGNRFTIGFDGAELFSVEDSTFIAAGKVALWTKADSVTHFDSMAITVLP
jgi:hypothetical protein